MLCFMFDMSQIVTSFHSLLGEEAPNGNHRRRFTVERAIGSGADYRSLELPCPIDSAASGLCLGCRLVGAMELADDDDW